MSLEDDNNSSKFSMEGKGRVGLGVGATVDVISSWLIPKLSPKPRPTARHATRTQPQPILLEKSSWLARWSTSMGWAWEWFSCTWLGLDKIFKDAGFEWRMAGCSMCLAMNPDQLAPGERCAATSNRNFEGRQGRGGRTHLMSPAMAAAAAVTGKLTDVRELA